MKWRVAKKLRSVRCLVKRLRNPRSNPRDLLSGWHRRSSWEKAKDIERRRWARYLNRVIKTAKPGARLRITFGTGDSWRMFKFHQGRG